MAIIRRLVVSPPFMNSSSPCASERDQLQELFDSPYTGAVTTRTATLTGFKETSEHTVCLFVSVSVVRADTPWRLPWLMSPYPLLTPLATRRIQSLPT